MQAKSTRTERFWAKVDKSGECWLWTAGVNRAGYGKFTPGYRQTTGAHRYSWELHFGPIPTGLFVCHRCDNPPCVRPEHLFVGTTKDNAQDMARKGRGSFSGARNPGAKRRWVADKPCEICGTMFRPKAQQIHRGQGRYCSKKCMGLANRGTGNPNYRHGREIRQRRVPLPTAA